MTQIIRILITLIRYVLISVKILIFGLWLQDWLFCIAGLMLMMMMMVCFCGMVDRGKTFTPYFQPGPLSEILTIAILRHTTCKIWPCTESEFRFCWRKLCSSDNHYTTAPRYIVPLFPKSTYSIYLNKKLS